MQITRPTDIASELPELQVRLKEKSIFDHLILVVDDSEAIRDLISLYLELGGYNNIAVAENGQAALEIVNKKKPDIIVLDLQMPVMDGFEFCEIINSNPDSCSIPILVQSGNGAREDVKRAFDLGAVDMIRKPVQDYELLARVRTHLGNKILLQQLTEYSSRVSQELEAAKYIQQSIYPTSKNLKNIYDNLGLEVLCCHESSSELGGDIWGIKQVADQKISFFITDFSGHGVAASLNTFRLHSWISKFYKKYDEPARLMEKLNNFLCDILPGGVYATMLIGQIDTATGWLTYSAAGTPAPILKKPGQYGTFSFCDSRGLPLGFRRGWQYENRKEKFEKGSSLLLYSDALVEATDQNGSMLGEESLIDEVRSAFEATGSPIAVLQHVVNEFGQLNTESVPDDLTVILLTYEGLST